MPRLPPAFGAAPVSFALPQSASKSAPRRGPVPRRGFTLGFTRGFTLIEILVVLVLLAAITAVVAGVMSGGVGGMRLRSTAKEIAGELRNARALAMARSEPQRFTIDPEKRTWTGVRDRSGEIPKELEVTFVGARELQPAEGMGAIVFFEDGASSGGRIQLRYKRGGMDVDVTWLTGEVRVRRMTESEVPR